MRQILQVTFVLLFLSAVPGPCWGQSGVGGGGGGAGGAAPSFPVVPHGGTQSGSGSQRDPLAVALEIGAVLGIIVVIGVAVSRWRNRTVGLLRIVDVPPGEPAEP